MSRQVDVKALISHIIRGDGADKCRICLGDTSEGQVYLGDTVMMDGDRPVTLSELLEVITGVEVVVPELPNSVCASCMVHVSAAIPFIQLSWESSRKLRQIVDFLYQCEVPDDTKHLYLVFDENGAKTYIDNTRCPTLSPTSKKAILRNFKNRLNRYRSYVKRYKSHNNEEFQIKEEEDKEMGNINLGNNANIKNISKNIKKEKCINTEKKRGYRITWQETSTTCPECEYYFESHTDFIKHIRNLNLKVCPCCKKIFAINDLPKHVFKDHGIKILSCEICSETFYKNASASLQYHKKKYHTDRNLNQYCTVCRRSYPGLANHLLIHRPETCLGCNKSYTNLSCFKRHSCTNRVPKPQNPQIFVCDICSTEYKSKSGLIFHMTIQHLHGKSIMCEICGKTFLDVSALRRHKTKHEKIRGSFSCICGSTYSTKQGYKQHYKRIHLGKKSNQRKQNDSLPTHKKKHYCIECNKSFPTYNGLATHLPMHTPRACAGCNEIFTNRIHFKRHSCSNPVPKSEKFICDHCSTEYKNKHSLRIHIVNQHLVGRMHQCDKCGKTFMSRASLLEHGNTHEKIYRYDCKTCDRKYSTRRGYQKHVQKHLGIIPNDKPRAKKQCSICDYKCCNKRNLLRHMDSKHKVMTLDKDVLALDKWRLSLI